MTFDSFGIFAAFALFCAAVASWRMAAPLRVSARLYLRFAAMLFAALSAARLAGLADAAALFLLPLAGAALMVAALALYARPLPVLAVASALVLALACGLVGLIAGRTVLSLAPVIPAGLVIIAVSLSRFAAIPALAGAALLAAGFGFLEQGAQAGVFVFSAAALLGLCRPSALAVQYQRHPRRADTAVSGLP